MDCVTFGWGYVSRSFLALKEYCIAL